MWSKARAMSEEDFSHEKIFTEDKVPKSLMIFCPDANADIVFLAFKAGLIKCIYPSANLQEIKYFPEGIKKAIKRFRTKVAAAKDANIYINFQSTIPDWEHEKRHPAYHFIEVGLAKQRPTDPSKVMNEEQDFINNNLVKLRVDGFLNILKKTQKIKPEQLVKLNYCSDYCIITSSSGSPLSNEENQAIIRFEDLIFNNLIEAGPATKEGLCKRLKNKGHSCPLCEKETVEIEDITSTATDEDSFN
jgi:hypothetical protein